MNLSVHRLICVVIPILCLTVGGWVVWNQNHRLNSRREEMAQLEKNIQVQKNLIATISQQPEAQKVPSAPMSEGEQASFLDGLRTLARDSQVTLVKWSNVTPSPEQVTDAKSLPQGVVPILSNLEVRGEYDRVRTFLYGVAKAPRLLNFSAIRWSRTSDMDPSTVLSVTITRYVSPGTETASAATPPSGSASTEKSS